MKKELYKKHRPKKFSSIVGQEAQCDMLKRMVKEKRVPHTILFTGPSGCGKTTLARILKRKLKCSQSDFNELNCADVRGIDHVRKIRHQMQALPLHGKCRIWLIDEAHKLTNEAQNALLKMLEDTPQHVYFMLATTNPEKLIKTIKTRSTIVDVEPLSEKELGKLIERISKKEKNTPPIKVQDRIIKYADGSARKALVLLNQVIGMTDPEKMLKVIERTTAEESATSIARALISTATTWSKMAGILKEHVKEDAESLRWGIIMYAKVVLVSASGGQKVTARCYLIIDAFRENFFDSKHAGLAAACYEVIVGND